MLNMSLIDAKMQYIRNWQALQGFGITYFVVRIGKSKRDELLGIAYNRLILFDAHTLEEKQIWRYSAMKSWNVNWESKQMRIDHEQANISFTCMCADLKIVHEFIGGNIWLSLRKPGVDLDVSMLVKLTGGVTSNLEGWGAETMAKFS
jgi:kindlin 2